MTTLQNLPDSQTRMASPNQNLHETVILFNHMPPSDEKKSFLKELIEKRIASLDDATWDLIPVS